MDLLPLHIEYLLTRHDCVIVPGVGAFIATETEACIDTENGVITPRRREISFNSSVITDDGLLTHSIARHQSLPYEEARRLVSSLIERMMADLDNEGESAIGMIGKLLKDAEGLISFQPRHTTVYSDILPDIKLTACIDSSVSDLTDSDNDNAEDENAATEKFRVIHVPSDRYVFTISKRAVHTAAMLIMILTIGLSLLIPINHDNEQKASVLSIEELFHHKNNYIDSKKVLDNNIPKAEATDSIVVMEQTSAQ